VIAKKGKAISKADAMKHVWGYTIINDVSARDVQAKHVQFHIGKSFDTFCPMGPWVVTADQVDANDISAETVAIMLGISKIKSLVLEF
ncbi:MAG: fumarylacetoacetate hydrolase family protein, partial [Polynucleobacter victoriensis]